MFFLQFYKSLASPNRHFRRVICHSPDFFKRDALVGPFYLVSMPGAVKDPAQGVNVSWTPHSNLEKDNSLNHSCVSPKMGCLEYGSFLVRSTNGMRVTPPISMKFGTLADNA